MFVRECSSSRKEQRLREHPTPAELRSYRRYLRREESRQRRMALALEAAGELNTLLNNKAEIPSLRGLGTLRALLDRSWAIRHENPEETKCLAQLAVSVAGRLDPRWHDQRDAADWQARAWGRCGNAHRAADDLDDAERDFGIAFDFLRQGTGDLPLKAHLYDLHSSYLGTRRQFDLAFAALDIVHSTYLELGDSHQAGRALLVKAIYTFYNNKPEEAIRINNAGMALIERHRDHSLVFMAIHNHLSFLVGCGEYREARKALFKQLGNLQGIGHVSQLKIRWLQAQISAGLQDWQSAEDNFLYVVEGFDQEGMGFATAFASLELAVVWKRQGRDEETQKLVLKVADVFLALRIQREVLGAMMVLKDAFEKQMGTIGLLEDAVEFLRRWYVNPNEKFMPRGE